MQTSYDMNDDDNTCDECYNDINSCQCIFCRYCGFSIKICRCIYCDYCGYDKYMCTCHECVCYVYCNYCNGDDDDCICNLYNDCLYDSSNCKCMCHIHRNFQNFQLQNDPIEQENLYADISQLFFSNNN